MRTTAVLGQGRLISRALVGKTALVTGASGGIGQAISVELARRGARVLLAGRNRKRLEDLQRLVEEIDLATTQGSRILECDLRDTSSIRAMARQAEAVDILVNSAGISRDSLVARQGAEDLEEMMQVNLVGVMEVCKMFVPGMMRRRSGCVVNVASVVGLHGNVGQSAYAATKAGLVGYTKALAREAGTRGVRCNVVAPGFIHTEMTKEAVQSRVSGDLVARVPLGRLGLPEDVAHGVAYLAEAQYVAGQVLVIDGGLFI
ncbi:hypothetical protein GGI07_000559 [Coemansia sp. Benny D115]|nr:hypothetical protein GGI07_000559 [Coemansia sp. Benny D115]